jgi:hypothetical protein
MSILPDRASSASDHQAQRQVKAGAELSSVLNVIDRNGAGSSLVAGWMAQVAVEKSSCITNVILHASHAGVIISPVAMNERPF